MKLQIKWMVVFLIISLVFSSSKERFSILSSQGNKVTISFSNEELTEEIKGDYVRLIGSGNSTIDSGLPELPIFTFSYGIDPYKEYNVSYNIKASYEISNIEIHPYQNPKENMNLKDGSLYIDADYHQSYDNYPKTIINETRSIMRGNELLSIDLVPFSYDLNNKNLVVYDEVEIIIEEIEDREQIIERLENETHDLSNQILTLKKKELD